MKLKKEIVFFIIFTTFISLNFLFLRSPDKIVINRFTKQRNNNSPLSSNNNSNNVVFDARSYIGLNGNEDALTGKGITVAIIDSGIDPEHSAFEYCQQRIYMFYDAENEMIHNSPYDNSGHGTWVASILGADCAEYRGVAPEVGFIIIRLAESEDEDGFIFTAEIFEDIIDWIIENKDIYNIRITSISFGNEFDLDAIKNLNENAEKLNGNDILVVASAGNQGSGSGTICAPSSAKSALSVGGVYSDGQIYEKSGRGPTHEGTAKPDTCAPAVDIFGAIINKDFGTGTGTSASAPLIAGLAALLLEKDIELTANELKNIISLTSLKTNDPTTIKDNTQGWGVVQGYAALDALGENLKIKQNTEIEISLDEDFSVYCQPVSLNSGHYFFELEQVDSGKAEIFLFDSKPDENGEPNLISHSINTFTSDNKIKKVGIYVEKEHDYYLVIKLTDKTKSGDFVVTLVVEYRISLVFILLALNILVFIYEAKKIVKYRKNKKSVILQKNRLFQKGEIYG